MVVVLEGVAGLVGGDAQGRDGRAVVNALGQAQDLLAGVVVVGQLARLLFDGDLARPGGLKDLVGGLGPRSGGTRRRHGCMSCRRP